MSVWPQYILSLFFIFSSFLFLLRFVVSGVDVVGSFADDPWSRDFEMFVVLWWSLSLLEQRLYAKSLQSDIVFVDLDWVSDFVVSVFHAKSVYLLSEYLCAAFSRTTLSYFPWVLSYIPWVLRYRYCNVWSKPRVHLDQRFSTVWDSKNVVSVRGPPLKICRLAGCGWCNKLTST